MPPLSSSQVDRAGRTLRHWMAELVPQPADAEGFVIPDNVNQAFETLIAFRAEHAIPLVTANNGLRSMVRSEGCRVEVSQRLKRTPTIVQKLMREPTLALSRMQDIGGCRAVLDSIDEVHAVQRRLMKRRPVVSVSDYIARPRSSGYRAVHVIVMYRGRRIEIQLRTRVMHQWAVTVERLSGRLSMFLKAEGDHPVQQLMSVISQAMALEEVGQVVPGDVLEEMRRLREQAAPYLGGR